MNVYVIEQPVRNWLLIWRVKRRIVKTEVLNLKSKDDSVNFIVIWFLTSCFSWSRWSMVMACLQGPGMSIMERGTHNSMRTHTFFPCSDRQRNTHTERERDVCFFYHQGTFLYNKPHIHHFAVLNFDFKKLLFLINSSSCGTFIYICGIKKY